MYNVKYPEKETARTSKKLPLSTVVLNIDTSRKGTLEPPGKKKNSKEKVEFGSRFYSVLVSKNLKESVEQLSSMLMFNHLIKLAEKKECHRSFLFFTLDRDSAKALHLSLFQPHPLQVFPQPSP